MTETKSKFAVKINWFEEKKSVDCTIFCEIRQFKSADWL